MSGHAKTSYVVWVLYMVLTDSYYRSSWPVSKSLEHDYVWSGVSQPEIEGDIRSSVSLPSVRFFPQTILICIENNNAALTRSYPLSRLSRITASHLDTVYCGIPACLTQGCIGSQDREPFIRSVAPTATPSTSVRLAETSQLTEHKRATRKSDVNSHIS